MKSSYKITKVMAVLIVLCASRASFAQVQQEWVARYNGPLNGVDEARAMGVDAAGNVYVTGLSWGSFYDYDYATIKYDADGNQLWVARYDGPAYSHDRANGLAVDAAGNVYVTGVSQDVNGDYATIKYSQP